MKRAVVGRCATASRATGLQCKFKATHLVSLSRSDPGLLPLCGTHANVIERRRLRELKEAKLWAR